MANKLLADYALATTNLQALVELEQRQLVRVKTQKVVPIDAAYKAKAVGAHRVLMGLNLAFLLYRLLTAIWYGRTTPYNGSRVGSQTNLNDMYREYSNARADALEYPLRSIPKPVKLTDREKKVPIEKIPIDAFFNNSTLGSEEALPTEIEDQEIEVSDDDEIVKAIETYSKHVEKLVVKEYDRKVDLYNKQVNDGMAYRPPALHTAAMGGLSKGLNNLLGGAAAQDSGMIGYARVSTTGTPCAFCAMLISRGPIYLSERSGGKSSGNTLSKQKAGEKYHDFCQCRAVPVASWEEYLNDPQFWMNRRLHVLWKETMMKQGYETLTELLKVWDEHVDKTLGIKALREQRRQNNKQAA